MRNSGFEIIVNHHPAFSWLGFAVLFLGLNAIPGQAAPAALALPSRGPSALTGSQFATRIASLSAEEREVQIEKEILAGNVPEHLRRFVPVVRNSVTNAKTNTVRFFVTADYLTVGTETDHLLIPMRPETAQRIADATGCLLPTRVMVDAIYEAAPIKLVPAPIPPSPEMITAAVFAGHNEMVRDQRAARFPDQPLDVLTAGHKKDVVLSNLLTNRAGKVAIYGWHRPGTNGQLAKPIQPLYTGHRSEWVDYSHGIRLVHHMAEVDGGPVPLTELLRNPATSSLLSDEGPLAMTRYRSEANTLTRTATNAAPETAGTDWITNNPFSERKTIFRLLPDVRCQLNEPLPAPDNKRPVLLVLYTLPNGNTIEQTAGRRIRPGEDWHFNIQHIAAQMRFVRATDTNRSWVVAYLEAAQKSWPAWRKAHASSGTLITGMVEQLSRRYPNARLALSGHSGGGSFIFGYFNAVEEIPDLIERVCFLDANYAYDPEQRHADKLSRWLKGADARFLSVFAYNDAVALLDGKPFVSATGGTWYRTHLMKTNLSSQVSLDCQTTGDVEKCSGLGGRLELLLRANPERRIWHTIMVERNGFIHGMFSGTAYSQRSYSWLGDPVYAAWIEDAPGGGTP